MQRVITTPLVISPFVEFLTVFLPGSVSASGEVVGLPVNGYRSSSARDGKRVLCITRVQSLICAVAVSTASLGCDRAFCFCAAFEMLRRVALMCRLYPFFPDLPPRQVEHLLLLTEFELLLKSIAPDHAHDLGQARVFHESVTKEHVVDTLSQAMQSKGAYLASQYVPRSDTLLLALHTRYTLLRSRLALRKLLHMPCELASMCRSRMVYCIVPLRALDSGARTIRSRI